MDSWVCRYYVVSYTTTCYEIRSLERGTNTPDLADRISKLRAAERLSELGGYCAARLVQWGFQAICGGGRENGYLSAVMFRSAALDISFLFQAVERPSGSGTRDRKLLRKLALQHARAIQYGAKHEGLWRRQAEDFENFSPLPLEATGESRSIEI